MGLDVPVNYPAAVGVFQRFGDLHGKVQGFLPVQHAFFLHILLQRDAVDQFHDNIVGIVGGGNVIHLHNIGMAQHGNGLALGMETAAELLIPGIFILQNFDRDQPVQPVAAGFIDNGHSAGSDHFQNLVPVVQQPSDISIHIHKIAPFVAMN